MPRLKAARQMMYVTSLQSLSVVALAVLQISIYPFALERDGIHQAHVSLHFPHHCGLNIPREGAHCPVVPPLLLHTTVTHCLLLRFKEV